LGDEFLQIARFAPQILHLAGRCLSRRIARRASLAGFEKFLRPAVVEAFGDPLTPAQLGDRVLAPQTRENDPDLLLGRAFLPCRTADGFDVLLGRLWRPGLLSHLRSLDGLR
jgi:hypothetical protein